MLAGRVVSADGRSVALIAEVEHIEDDFIYKVKLVRQIRAIVEQERAFSGVRSYHLAGGPVLDDALFRYSIRDALVYLPLCVLFAAAVTFFIFRRLSAVLVVMLVVVQSLLWTAGAMAAWGFKANILSTILVPILMCASIGEAIHIVVEYYAELDRGRDRLSAMTASLETLMTPCLVTSMTTAAGLLSLGVSELGVLRETGLIGALGILVAFGLSMTLLPAVLTWAPLPPRRSIEPRESDRLAWILAKMGRASVAFRGSVLGCSALLVLAGVLGITRLTVNANFIDHFGKNDPVRLDTEFVDQHLQGTVSVEFLLRAPERNGILEPDVLRALEALEVFLESLPGVTSVHGLCETLREIHGVLRGGGPSGAVLPDNARLSAQLLLAMEGSGITESIVDTERRVARQTAYVRVKDSIALASHVREIEAFLERHFPPPLSASMTGVVKVAHDVQDYILTILMSSERYDDALKRLRAKSAKDPNDKVNNQAIVTVLIRAGKLDEAIAYVKGLGARADGVSHYTVGVAAWDKAYHDPMLSPEQRAVIVDAGIESLRKSVAMTPDSFDSLVYLNLILREKAKLEVDPVKQQELIAEAVIYQDKAKAIVAARKAQAAAAS
jgi:hypothetical protein